MDPFSVSGEENAECFEAGVFDLILQIGDEPDLSLGDIGVLEAGHLYPRSYLLQVQRQTSRRLQDAKRKHTFLFDARLLRVQLSESLGSGSLKTQALLRHQQQSPALLAGL